MTALILLNGVFAGAEIALIALRRTRLRELAAQGSRRARAALALKDQPERLLATVQIGITAVGATAAAYGGNTFAVDLAPLLEELGFGAYANDAAFVAVVVIITFLSVVLGELVPKSLALHSAETYGLLVSPPLLGVARIMRPLVWVLTTTANAVLRLFRDQTTFTEARHSPEELQQFVEDATASGTLDVHAGEIASRAFDFGDINVGSVMVPRRQIRALDVAAKREDLVATLREGGYARYPVHEGELDRVIGYVVARDALGALAAGGEFRLRDHVRALHFFPENTLAIAALRELQRRRTQLALVVDELGAVVGLVTIEDLVEELVGEIVSEHGEPPREILPEADGSYLVQGSAAVHEVNRALGLSLPEGESWDTIGGLCIAQRGWIPQAGERFELDGGVSIEVVEVSPRRVKTVRIAKRAEEQP
ncbi:MAG: HlyC/CorC family transporter [Proteobacteria bacterium]|nr:MAG: HlyC/CorC family transporter [Pseudomonadota bacterium]